MPAKSSVCSAATSGGCACALTAAWWGRCWPDGPDHFTVTADVVVSPQFFAWVFGFHTLAQIVGPPDVVEKMREYLAQVAEMYPAQEQ